MLNLRCESASLFQSAFYFFYLILQAAYRIFQLGDELGSLQLYLGFSSQRTSFHCTIIEATLYTTSGQEMCVYVCLKQSKV